MLAKLMLIRHAEKPVPGVVGGVDASGLPDERSLTPQGWQRAGALARLFAPRAGAPLDAGLARPDAIYASGAGPQSKSLRPLQTVQPLAALTGQTVRTQFGKGQEAALVAALLAEPGAALVSWQHERATAIAAALAPGLAGVPQGWPDARFDVVWVFDRHGGGWAFSQVCQLLLAGDRDHAVA